MEPNSNLQASGWARTRVADAGAAPMLHLHHTKLSASHTNIQQLDLSCITRGQECTSLWLNSRSRGVLHRSSSSSSCCCTLLLLIGGDGGADVVASNIALLAVGVLGVLDAYATTVRGLEHSTLCQIAELSWQQVQSAVLQVEEMAQQP